jgi:hypothetical protein
MTNIPAITRNCASIPDPDVMGLNGSGCTIGIRYTVPSMYRRQSHRTPDPNGRSSSPRWPSRKSRRLPKEETKSISRPIRRRMSTARQKRHIHQPDKKQNPEYGESADRREFGPDHAHRTPPRMEKRGRENGVTPGLLNPLSPHCAGRRPQSDGSFNVEMTTAGGQPRTIPCFGS